MGNERLNMVVHGSWNRARTVYTEVAEWKPYAPDHDDTCAPECNNTDFEHRWPQLDSYRLLHIDWAHPMQYHTVGVVVGRLYSRAPSFREAIEFARKQEYDFRRVEYSTAVGHALTQEQVEQVDSAARRISTVTAHTYTSARDYVLRLMSYGVTTGRAAGKTETALEANYDAWDTLYSGSSNGPNYDHWWEGLEHVRARHHKSQVYARHHRANTRGSYHYQGKAPSYWRHTRTR